VIGPDFSSHETVNHRAEEYVRGDTYTTRRRLLFDLKRGMKGVYQHFAEKHLHRYLQNLTSLFQPGFPWHPRRGTADASHQAARLEDGTYRH